MMEAEKFRFRSGLDSSHCHMILAQCSTSLSLHVPIINIRIKITTIYDFYSLFW